MNKKLYLGLTKNEELILNAVLNKERYGLDLIDTIAEASGGLIKIGMGAIYPALNRLEQKGFISGRFAELAQGETGARRKYYQATEQGKECINFRRQFFQELSEWTSREAEV